MDNELECKGKNCHLFHVDWRTGEENCTIGYSSTHKQGNHSDIVSDTYAEETRMRLGYKPEPFPERKYEREPVQPVVRTEMEETIPFKPVIEEEIVMETEHTTVIHSHENVVAEQADEGVNDISEKEDHAEKSKLDKMMNLDDLPEDYEKEFWN
ncbi:hypothetical protein J7W08_10595 [Methanococcoides orientis]|uniref:hypothetical protein n=1 Tax=Methanococcoides orientis TaxID=2822137 RepID=UPI001E40D6CE|nr:hypothetical protein [Methanococcoides orientis]UGV40499.1 hypothetical protein J7W08_10595 [Methanococcoides orientis]